MHTHLVTLVLFIVFIIVFCISRFSDIYKDDWNNGRNLHILVSWIIIAVTVVIVIYVFVAKPGSEEYGFGQKIRAKYENTVDTLKAKAIDKRRVRIAKKTGLTH